VARSDKQCRSDEIMTMYNTFTAFVFLTEIIWRNMSFSGTFTKLEKVTISTK